MMKRAVVLLTASFLLVTCSKDLDQYQVLLDPQINEKAGEKMLVYEAKGDPNETVGNAFGALISTFYKLKRSHDMEFQAPRARWPLGPDTPKDQWIGIYALPVALTVEEIPSAIQEEHPLLKLETWEYGLVAEILHIGSYASENHTVDRLHAFIESEGYEIIGPHEEEYLKGPGMFMKGNENKYQTIIRYPVAPKAPPAAVMEADTTAGDTTQSIP